MTVSRLAEMGLPAMDDLDCPNTYHLGKSLNLREEPSEPRSGGMNKPLGLWTAPGRLDADGGLKTAWSDRQIVEYGDQAEGNLYTVAPLPGAVVLRLETDDDLRALGTAFPRFHAGTSGWDGGPGHDDRVAAWNEVAESTGVDGVLVTDSLARAARSRVYRLDRTENPVLWGMYDALSTWDVGSVCWFRTDHVEVSSATLGPYPAAAQPSDDDDPPWSRRELEVDEGYGDPYSEGHPTPPRPPKRQAETAG